MDLTMIRVQVDSSSDELVLDCLMPGCRWEWADVPNEVAKPGITLASVIEGAQQHVREAHNEPIECGATLDLDGESYVCRRTSACGPGRHRWESAARFFPEGATPEHPPPCFFSPPAASETNSSGPITHGNPDSPPFDPCAVCGAPITWYVDDTGQVREWRHVDPAALRRWPGGLHRAVYAVPNIDERSP